MVDLQRLIDAEENRIKQFKQNIGSLKAYIKQLEGENEELRYEMVRLKGGIKIL